MVNKLKIGVVFGGRSGEHEVSLVSASSVIASLDRAKYEVIPIGITKDGRWFSGEGVMRALKAGKTPKNKFNLLPDPTHKNNLDIIFPVLHGPFGEDGTVQGLFELAGIPYVGAGVVGSSSCMDKIIQKMITDQAGIRSAPFVWFLASEYKKDKDAIINNIERSLPYPCFVKPANLGSSVGISKAHNKKELVDAIDLAAQFDRRILVEKGIEHAREIEVSVLGNDVPKASVLGEVIPSNEFYDYDAKYVDGKSKTIAPADLPIETARRIQEAAIKSFRATDCCGMVRADFLLRGNEFYLIEINTIPGFTSISMYPKLWEASGLPYSKLLDELIRLAMERHEEKDRLSTSYKPKEKWYV